MVLRTDDSGPSPNATATVAKDDAAASEAEAMDEVPEEAGAGEVEPPAADGPPDEVLLEIDRLIATGDDTAAMARIGPITDEYPRNGAVQWRYGRALALLGNRKRNSRIRAQALVAYEHALDAEVESLVDEALHEMERCGGPEAPAIIKTFVPSWQRSDVELHRGFR